MNKPADDKERRKYVRIKKQFILSYYEKTDPQNKYEATQLKNISLGGICFVTSRYFSPKSKISIELKTPYLAGTTHLEGLVLESHEKLANILYETRLQFDPLTSQAEFVIGKIVEYFKGSHAQ